MAREELGGCMSTDAARPTLRDVGYRRAILLLGALWGGAPALTFGTSLLGGLTPDQGFAIVGALATISLAVLFELDSRALDRNGEGVPMAWSYALVAPISFVLWATLGPLVMQVTGLGLLGIVVGPPIAALLYVSRRGRLATVE